MSPRRGNQILRWQWLRAYTRPHVSEKDFACTFGRTIPRKLTATDAFSPKYRRVQIAAGVEATANCIAVLSRHTNRPNDRGSRPNPVLVALAEELISARLNAQTDHPESSLW